MGFFIPFYFKLSQLSFNYVNKVELNNFGKLSGINIYPNPTKVEVTIRFDNIQEGQHTLEVLDATGRVLNSQKLNNNAIQVNLSNYETGIYFIKIANGNNESVHRVMKR
jgi:hypothetical protein